MASSRKPAKQSTQSIGKTSQMTNSDRCELVSLLRKTRKPIRSSTNSNSYHKIPRTADINDSVDSEFTMNDQDKSSVEYSDFESKQNLLRAERLEYEEAQYETQNIEGLSRDEASRVSMSLATPASSTDESISNETTSDFNVSQTGACVKKNQKPRRRVATVAQRRAANIRERRRMFNLNSAFDRLRKKVPSFAYEKRLSRIETLKLAIMYIRFMDNLVNDEAYVEKYKQLLAQSAQSTNGYSSGGGSSYLTSIYAHRNSPLPQLAHQTSIQCESSEQMIDGLASKRLYEIQRQSDQANNCHIDPSCVGHITNDTIEAQPFVPQICCTDSQCLIYRSRERTRISPITISSASSCLSNSASVASSSSPSGSSISNQTNQNCKPNSGTALRSPTSSSPHESFVPSLQRVASAGYYKARESQGGYYTAMDDCGQIPSQLNDLLSQGDHRKYLYSCNDKLMNTMSIVDQQQQPPPAPPAAHQTIGNQQNQSQPFEPATNFMRYTEDSGTNHQISACY